LNKAFAVSGIHLDKEATLRDIGNVETGVKLYEE
jgi:hypothetical protein